MGGGLTHLVLSGPLILAVPVAAAAGAVTFLSPCVLPLVPGYLSYVTGMSGADTEASQTMATPASPGGTASSAEGSPGTATGGAGTSGVVAVRQAPAAAAGRRPVRRRAVTGTALFVLGFSAVFASEGAAFGDLGSVLRYHSAGLTQILGALTILLGLMFAGVFDRFAITGRIIRPSARPRAGLAGAPLLGALFGLGWTPCIGPTLSVAVGLAATSGTAVRGAVLMFAYSLGLGIPFLIVAAAFQRSMTAFAFARRHARLFARAGGAMLVGVGLLEVTGAWTAALTWLQTHWVSGYQSPI
jgi:cytochrome c-type biogenesis protein